MSNELSIQQCEACHSSAPQVSDDELKSLLKQIPDWVPQVHNKVMMLEREYKFKNYKLAWAFANKVSELAESEFHHPAILLEWGKVKVTWWTHAIGGLHKNDFICAAKTDQLLSD
ncbi:4a-hydroxytetrahydrobiopterin dehydratase [Colwellia sp. 4_MG-2023]|jgi:4a-hydroxytetrahydrobiopterin dehydratase|uniref:4a-hydroxytetrahydrobiopterin dehydratase n=1 Tax=unclassified Colwellia TaxID=196834 RepID=UPI001C090EFC|nr:MULTISPECIES: 4a-hydroxytetrahydrobiopterin dehydratase [unclassified Colwellia]MBU2925221.1 4a-hydroxytetrahydrobiopterin dehydratase [Colwellia sp. C2M11]MDO6486720.1 4a-hydroxytetrahydrobiopterin dehydratase [Colwellia sp. 6_MG-2023]MDO6506906.1 4a-hydroxytetrahydrobiopterin dehydratase [Colwellia sp. 5_MG-2023]MDO6556656.1 4a-hydroxytetrahydrobiopterin dehydratase [Colwellia sp. 4_MG-2023]MDO6651254.1 4a-hydroxytetrahydrobiopterin dehydratase [Colwellia sp. 3_MG-2023]